MFPKDQNAKIAYGIAGIAIFLIAVFTALHFFVYIPQGASNQQASCTPDAASCPHESQVLFLQEIIPLLMGASLIAGSGVYYFMSQKLEAKENVMKKSTDIVLQLLNTEERKVIDKLLENRGKILQAEISRLPGMSKVKSHRIIKKLIARGVLETEGIGKTNVVRFRKEIMDGLFS